MHKQLSSLLSDGGSPGQLADYARQLADRGINIRAIGGSEWDHRGAVATLIDSDLDDAEITDWLGGKGYPTRVISAAEAVLPDEPGSLATACERIGGPDNDLNILTILVADTHGGVGLVSFGFETEAEADTARERLGDFAVERHGLTAAWDDHEAWDKSNRNPRPDPHHPGGGHGPGGNDDQGQGGNRKP
jgi:hypothetical protein